MPIETGMKLTVNGQDYRYDGDGRAEGLLLAIGVEDLNKVALVINARVVARAEMTAFRLQDGDSVDVLTLAGGG